MKKLEILALRGAIMTHVQITFEGVIVGTFEFMNRFWPIVRIFLGSGSLGVQSEGFNVSFIERDAGAKQEIVIANAFAVTNLTGVFVFAPKHFGVILAASVIFIVTDQVFVAILSLFLVVKFLVTLLIQPQTNSQE